MFLCMFTTFVVSGQFLSFYVAKYSSETSFYIMFVVSIVQNFSYLVTALKNPGVCSSSNELSEQQKKSGEYLFLFIYLWILYNFSENIYNYE